MLAVQISAAPLILFITHKFPLMSLPYNLFFPFLVSISIFLLILGLLTGFPSIHQLNSSYTEFVLNLTYGLPTSFDYWVRIDHFPAFLLVFIYCLLFLAAIYSRQWLESRGES